MKKVPISVHRISGDQATFLIPSNLDNLEVRGIVESVMEMIMLETYRHGYDVEAIVQDNRLERGEHE